MRWFLLLFLLPQFAGGGRLTGVNVSVRITNPTTASTFDAGTADTITVGGTSTSDRTMTLCTWVNSLGGSGSALGTTTYLITGLPLTVGSNVVTVTCRNIEGTQSTAVITITRSSGSSSSLLDSSRKIDWSTAGVVGGIRAHATICQTLNPGATNAQIQSAYDNCTTGQAVKLNAGTYNNIGPLHLNRSDVSLRGAGANQTFLVLTNSDGCGGICIGPFPGDNTYESASQSQPGGAQAATWVSGFTQGSTQIVLNAIGSNGIHVGQYLYLDQGDVSSPTGNFFVCDNTTFPCSLEGPNGQRVIGGIAHGKIQHVKVTACSPSCTNNATFTITPGLYGTDWGTGANPGAWWPSALVEYTGIEDLSVDGSGITALNNIGMYNAVNSWVSGVRSINPTRAHVQFGAATHCQVQHSYFYGTKNAASQSYGIESYRGSDNLVLNNIAHRVSSPWMTQITTGNVFLYNFDVLDYYCAQGSAGGCNDNVNGTNTLGQTTMLHNAGVEYTLWEGNVTPGMKGDVFHGSGGLQTFFRNYVAGWAPFVGTHETIAFTLEPYNRAYNIIGNVLGREGHHTGYENTGVPIYVLGQSHGNGSVTVAADPGVATTLYRWGNYDVVNAATRFVNSEVPSGIGAYAQAVPSDHTLPNSLYFSSQPLWWPVGKPWPLIGPDVTGGNVSGYGGHINTNPAQDCYINVMGGPSDGTGPILSFNRQSCYPGS